MMWNQSTNRIAGMTPAAKQFLLPALGKMGGTSIMSALMSAARAEDKLLFIIDIGSVVKSFSMRQHWVQLHQLRRQSA